MDAQTLANLRYDDTQPINPGPRKRPIIPKLKLRSRTPINVSGGPAIRHYEDRIKAEGNKSTEHTAQTPHS